MLYLEKWSQKYNLTSGNVFNRLKYGKARAAASRAVVLYDTCPSESNFILEKWIACQTRALTQHYKMRIRITGFKYLFVEEYLFAGPSMQQQRAVDRTMMRHLARHLELNLSQLIMVDSLNESPNQVLQYL